MASWVQVVDAFITPKKNGSYPLYFLDLPSQEA